MKHSSREAYQLLHDGSLALAGVEANGIRIDLTYLHKAMRKTERKIGELEEQLKGNKIYRKWEKAFGTRLKLGSSEQLSHVVFDVLGCEVKSEKTQTGRLKADESSFSHIDIPFVKSYFTWKKQQKLLSTYLEGLRREVVDGYLHPFFHLHTARSYRSSSSEPNFQNFPIRDPEIGKTIRRCFIPRPNHILVEIDYSGIEVKIAQCYHCDPTMLEYITDPTKDMHRDMAAECYLLDPKDVNKQVRYCGKNLFVFPQFYGSFYVDCAMGLWEALDKMKLVVGDKSLKEHLAEQGIKKLGDCNERESPKPGTFEYHIKQVETEFWDVRFPVYKQWKDSWYRQYRKEAGFTTLTGFRINGLYRRNEVINLPVQGSAFHCLLWSLIQLQNWLVAKGLRSMIVGQIHDSLVLDVHKDELQLVLRKAKKIMTRDLLDNWKWITTPMETEVECSEISWADKGQWVEKGGEWQPKEVAV